jgi:hypothetical protein
MRPFNELHHSVENGFKKAKKTSIVFINRNIKTKRLFIRELIVFERVFRGILGSPYTLETVPAHFLKPTKLAVF